MTQPITGPGGNSAAVPATAPPVSPMEPVARTVTSEDRRIAEAVEPAESLLEPKDRWESGSQVTQVETRISVDSSTQKMVVQVVDARTQETIREIPPEKIREMAEYLSQFLGLRMDERA